MEFPIESKTLKTDYKVPRTVVRCYNKNLKLLKIHTHDFVLYIFIVKHL